MQQLKINIYKINMQKNSIMVFKVCYHYELLFEHRTSVTNCTASMKTTKLANWHNNNNNDRLTAFGPHVDQWTLYPQKTGLSGQILDSWQLVWWMC